VFSSDKPIFIFQEKLVSQSTQTEQRSLFMTVILLTTARLTVNIARRFAYPFIPEISRELGVPQTSVQTVTSLQAGIGVTSPLFGPLAERYGRKRVMVGALLMMALASGTGALFPQFSIYLVMMLVLGAGKMIFDPAMQAYIGDRVPYARRGAALGVMELAWAGSLIIAAPAVGWLLYMGSLRLVLAALMLSLLTAAAIVMVSMPSDRLQRQGTTHTQATSLRGALRILFSNRVAIIALGYTLTIAIANEIFFINYGGFMETRFGMLPTELGAATTIIAFAEIMGELLVIGIADRFGKRRLSLIAAVVGSMTYFALPAFGLTLPAALIGLFVMFLCVETAIVAAIPIYTEVLPEARSVMMSAAMGAASLGRLVGSQAGALLYSSTGNFLVLGVVSLTIGLAGAFLMWRYVQVE
jgi:MFS transporter, DHA1 family, inner membrane transport protein